MSSDYIFKFLRVVFIVVLIDNKSLAENSPLKVTENDVVTISLKKNNVLGLGQVFTQRVTVNATTDFQVNVEVTSDVTFIVAQFHAYQYNVVMSYDKNSNDLKRLVYGTNLGLVVETNGNKVAQVFVSNNNTETVDGLVAVVAYGKTAPYPGGCNMEFNVEVSPFQKVVVGNGTVTVDAQPASSPKLKGKQQMCEQQPLPHEAYRVYLPGQDYFTKEIYFSAIESMLTVANITKNANKIPASMIGSPMRRIYSAYPGTSSVYNVIAQYGNDFAAYVPIFSTACESPIWTEQCPVLSSILDKVICALTFFFGCYLVFQKQLYFKTTMVFSGLLVGGTIGYILAAYTDKIDSLGILTIALMSGVLLSALWFLMWQYVSSPMPSIFLSGLTFGSFTFCILYFGLPDGVLSFEVDAIYAIVFTTTVVLVILLFSIQPFYGYILSVGILSTYAVILPVDYYAGANLKYILINMIRRATVPNFDVAIIQPPFHLRDILLVLIWVNIAFCCVMKLYWNHRGRLPFPPANYRHQRRYRSERTPLLS